MFVLQHFFKVLGYIFLNIWNIRIWIYLKTFFFITSLTWWTVTQLVRLLLCNFLRKIVFFRGAVYLTVINLLCRLGETRLENVFCRFYDGAKRVSRHGRCKWCCIRLCFPGGPKVCHAVPPGVCALSSSFIDSRTQCNKYNIIIM